MWKVRKSKDRGFFDHGWLKTYHTFSFAGYDDPEYRGFRSLRVINEDFIEAGSGFGTHGHQNMEILTYVTEGALSHQDSMGNGSTIFPGEVQYMSAGSGVLHSEFNHEKNGDTRLFQIWILPNEQDAKPRYDQKKFLKEHKINQLCLLASPDGRESSIAIRQDAFLYSSILEESQKLEVSPHHPYAYLQVARGKLHLFDQALEAGDGIFMSSEKMLKIESTDQETEFLFFNLS